MHNCSNYKLSYPFTVLSINIYRQSSNSPAISTNPIRNKIWRGFLLFEQHLTEIKLTKAIPFFLPNCTFSNIQAAKLSIGLQTIFCKLQVYKCLNSRMFIAFQEKWVSSLATIEQYLDVEFRLVRLVSWMCQTWWTKEPVPVVMKITSKRCYFIKTI